MDQHGSYSNGFHHHSALDDSISNVPPPLPAASTMNGEQEEQDSSEDDPTNLELEGSSALDHALLESLFYNEMMMLNPSSPGSTNFLSQSFNEVTHPRQQQQQATATGADPNIIAEKDLLRDFGVSSSPIRPSTHRHHTLPEAPPVSTSTSSAATAAAPPHPSWSAAPPAVHPQHAYIYPAGPSHLQHQHQHQHQHQPPPSTQQHIPIYPAPSPLPVGPAYPMLTSHHNTETNFYPAVTTAVSASRPPLSINTFSRTTTATAAAAPRTGSSSSSNGKSAAAQDYRAKQLVDQFATLASRLGIELPTSVLQSLTAAAAQNDPQMPPGAATAEAAVAAASLKRSSSSSSTPPLTSTTSGGGLSPSKIQLQQQKQHPPDSSMSSLPTLADTTEDAMDTTGTTATGPPTLQELRKTAEEAIASVTRKRSALDMDGAESSGGGSNSGKDGGGGSKLSASQLHTKRKKKPRMSDCESRLAELRSENELLKRHLANVSHKAVRFDQEKEAAGKRIHGLLEDNAGPEEMNRAVQEFTEMYSDYGRNRQQELSFHLEQLQRLVNPTNFTKMGLWTLGQNGVSPKNNPIAGILQKELDITSQQGRKILDQSEKIRALCENLKECLALLAKLKALCQQKTQIFQNRMDKCREILTTKQVVKLIKWIDDHTQLLETVCPGWGTEHIHSSTSKIS